MMIGGVVWILPSMTKGEIVGQNWKLSLMSMVKFKEAPWVQ